MPFDNQNNLIFREPHNVGIRLIANGTTILTLDNSNIVSVSLSLKGVETKIDNPALQASTIEVEAYYKGDLSEFDQYRGKETIMQYRAAYTSNLWSNTGSTSECVGVRAFYVTIDNDNISLTKNHLLKIKGTDLTGSRRKETWMTRLYPKPDYPSYNRNGTYYHKFEDIAKAWTDWGIPPEAYIYRKAPTIYVYRTDPDYYYTWVMEPGNWRDRIAQFVNPLRGSNPNNVDKLIARAVYRDAGTPSLIWCPDDPINMIPTSTVYNQRFLVIRAMNMSNNIYNDTWLNGTWNIDYANVCDYEVEYGKAISKIIVDTPYAARRDGTQTISMRSNMSDIITLDTPGQFQRITVRTTGTGSTLPSTFSLTQISPTTAVVKCSAFSGTCEADIMYYQTSFLYNNSSTTSIPDLVYTTSITGGDTVQFNRFPWMRLLHGIDEAGTSYSQYYHARGYLTALNQCGLKQPRWIHFTWRGHPGMQPRDMILFTEKDGTKNYYEIDELTLEHRDGGLSSRVKAIYKFPYTEA